MVGVTTGGVLDRESFRRLASDVLRFGKERGAVAGRPPFSVAGEGYSGAGEEEVDDRGVVAGVVAAEVLVEALDTDADPDTDVVVVTRLGLLLCPRGGTLNDKGTAVGLSGCSAGVGY